MHSVVYRVALQLKQDTFAHPPSPTRNTDPPAPQIENADNNCPAEYIPPPDNDCHTDYHADITVTVAPVMKHETGRMKHSIKSPPEMVVIPADTNPSENHPTESEKLLEEVTYKTPMGKVTGIRTVSLTGSLTKKNREKKTATKKDNNKTDPK